MSMRESRSLRAKLGSEACLGFRKPFQADSLAIRDQLELSGTSEKRTIDDYSDCCLSWGHQARSFTLTCGVAICSRQRACGAVEHLRRMASLWFAGVSLYCLSVRLNSGDRWLACNFVLCLTTCPTLTVVRWMSRPKSCRCYTRGSTPL